MRARTLLCVLVTLLFGCAPGGDPRVKNDWTIGWEDRGRVRTKYHAGTVFDREIAEGTPQGVIVTHERWQLLRADSTEGEFEVRHDGEEPRVKTVRFHPVIPIVPMGGGGVSRHFEAKYPVVGGLVPLRMPAGHFDCARTWGSFEESDGRVMRRMQWWAPNVPVPVQEWVRWEGDDSLADPPRRRDDVAVGAKWTRLVSITQP